jgi:hypothetical protein
MQFLLADKGTFYRAFPSRKDIGKQLLVCYGCTNQQHLTEREKETMTILKRLTILALIGLLATACSSATVKESWVKPGYSEKVENVYLIGIAKEEEFRRLFEEGFKRKLTGQGVRAVTSHGDLPESQENSRENIIKEMIANGCDSVLLTKLIRKRTDKAKAVGPGLQVVKTTPTPLYLDPWYNNWGSYYNQSYSVVNIQPTTHGSVTLTIESVLYDLKTEERIWSVQLESVKEINIVKMTQDYVEAVVRNLKDKDLI